LSPGLDLQPAPFARRCPPHRVRDPVARERSRRTADFLALPRRNQLPGLCALTGKFDGWSPEGVLSITRGVDPSQLITDRPLTRRIDSGGMTKTTLSNSSSSPLSLEFSGPAEANEGTVTTRLTRRNVLSLGLAAKCDCPAKAHPTLNCPVCRLRWSPALARWLQLCRKLHVFRHQLRSIVGAVGFENFSCDLHP
jgi:hypothetical protein